jgi:hypothetical protein
MLKKVGEILEKVGESWRPWRTLTNVVELWRTLGNVGECQKACSLTFSNVL